MSYSDSSNKHNHSTFSHLYIRGQYEKLPSCLREIMSDNEKHRRKIAGLSFNELIQMQLKFSEIKELAKKNYILPSKLEGDKRIKRTWVKAINRLPANWSINTFIVGVNSNKKHILNGQMDILLMIQKFM